jgi:hypothetical protein
MRPNFMDDNSQSTQRQWGSKWQDMGDDGDDWQHQFEVTRGPNSTFARFEGVHTL